MSGETLPGTWSLVDFVVRFPDGREVERPFGRRPLGRLVYTTDGFVSAVLSRADRAGVATTLEAAREAAVDERAAWTDGYLSYSGRWTLAGDTVTHSIDLALVPSVIGTEVRRRVRFVDGGLELSYSRTSRAGTVRTFVLTWERAR